MNLRTVVVAIVAVAMLASMAVVATADTVTYPGAGNPNSTASGNVTVSARVNPKITLTITTPDAGQTVAFGDVDPMSGATEVVGVQVSSNKTYDLTKVVTGDDALMGLSTSLADQVDQSKGTNAYSDTYTLNTPYTTDPGDYSATVAYTVLQK